MKDKQQMLSVDNEFDAAKVIVETLKGLDQKMQERAVRFASETLGLHAFAVPPSPGSPPPAGQGHLPVDKPDPSPPDRAVDIKQFTESKAPKTDQQFAVVVAYYYRFKAPPEDQKEVIEPGDIVEAVRLVGGRHQPKDPAMTLTNAKNKGYLDATERGKYKLNAVGENLVAMTLPGKDQQTPTARKAGNTAKKKKRKTRTKKRRKVSK